MYESFFYKVFVHILAHSIANLDSINTLSCGYQTEKF
jgi:hypothetical protein